MFSVFWPDESGQLLDKPTDFKQSASDCFPLPAGEGSRVRGKTPSFQRGHSFSKTALKQPFPPFSQNPQSLTWVKSSSPRFAKLWLC